MTEEELLLFIAQIIACGKEENIRLSMTELKNILEREGAEIRLIQLVEDLIPASYETAELGEKKGGKPVTMNELGLAIREGRERIRRLEAARC